MIVDHDRCEWVNVSSGTSSPGFSWTKCREPSYSCVCVDSFTYAVEQHCKNEMHIVILFAVSHLEDLVLIDSTSVCGVKASESCSASEALESGQLLMLSLWQQATLAQRMDHCTLFDGIISDEQLHYACYC